MNAMRRPAFSTRTGNRIYGWNMSEIARDIQFRLIATGCRFDFRLRRWTCPVCRTHSTLHVRRVDDGATAFTCERGCALYEILDRLGLAFVDVAPAHRRRAG